MTPHCCLSSGVTKHCVLVFGYNTTLCSSLWVWHGIVFLSLGMTWHCVLVFGYDMALCSCLWVWHGIVFLSLGMMALCSCLWVWYGIVFLSSVWHSIVFLSLSMTRHCFIFSMTRYCMTQLHVLVFEYDTALFSCLLTEYSKIWCKLSPRDFYPPIALSLLPQRSSQNNLMPAPTVVE